MKTMLNSLLGLEGSKANSSGKDCEVDAVVVATLGHHAGDWRTGGKTLETKNVHWFVHIFASTCTQSNSRGGMGWMLLQVTALLNSVLSVPLKEQQCSGNGWLKSPHIPEVTLAEK